MQRYENTGHACVLSVTWMACEGFQGRSRSQSMCGVHACLPSFLVSKVAAFVEWQCHRTLAAYPSIPAIQDTVTEQRGASLTPLLLRSSVVNHKTQENRPSLASVEPPRHPPRTSSSSLSFSLSSLARPRQLSWPVPLFCQRWQNNTPQVGSSRTPVYPWAL
jgi:hypothetical protein